MARPRLSIIATVAILALAALMVHEQSKLREENRLLRKQTEGLAPLQAENERLSKLLAQAKDDEKILHAQISELPRLRSEVGTLRRQTNELAKLRSDNEQLRSFLLSSNFDTTTPVTGESLRKASWAPVGYADPESAFQSTLWAMSQGDAKTFRASVVPGSGEFADWTDKSDPDLSATLKGETEKVTGFQIIGKEAVSDDTAILTVVAQGINEVAKFKFQRLGNEWKIAGPMREVESR
jgi:hypothetical protein